MAILYNSTPGGEHECYDSSLLITYLLTQWSRVLLEKLTGFAANEEIPRILWNPKIHYRTHKRPPHVTLNYMLIFSVAQQCFEDKFMSPATIKRT